MYKYITDLYNAVSKFEQLKNVAGFSEFARAKATRRIFTEFLKKSNRPYEALEIGPASGFITEYLSAALPPDGSCTLDLMDFSEGFLQNCKAKNYKIRDYICFDVTHYQEKQGVEGRYDIVFFQEVLEHLVSPFTALVNINNLLKNDGLLFLTIPNAGNWRKLYVENFRQSRLLEPGLFLDTHISELSTLGLIRLVSMAGFDVLEVDYYCSRYPFFKALTSTQVGFLLKKKSTPQDRWIKLTNDICNAYTGAIK